MTKAKKQRSTNGTAALVRSGGKIERRLLRREQRAEEELKDARVRLAKAQTRLERRLSQVADAEAVLRRRQAARATGPDGGGPALDGLDLVIAAAASGGDRTDGTLITGPEVHQELAAIETHSPTPQSATPKRRRRRAPAAPPAEPLTVAAAETAKPATTRRSRRASTAKTVTET